jgi:cytochrome P450
MTDDPCPALDRAADEFGRTFAVGVGPVRMVVVGDPQDLAQLFSTPVDAFRWGHALNVLRFVVGDGSMIVSDGPDHRRRRGAVQPAFGRRGLDAWEPMIVDEADRAIDDPATVDECVDLFPIARSCVLRIVLNVLFGSGLAGHHDEIGRLFEPGKEYLEQSAVRQIPHPIPWTRRARARRGRRGLDRLIDAEMARRRLEPDRPRADLLDTLLDAVSIDGSVDRSTGLSDAEVRDQVVTLIGAGYDTTTSALSWAILRGAGDPVVWARMRAEADAVLDGEIQPGTARQLEYATAVVREVLRLHPPGVFSPRQARRDVPLGDHVIPRRAMVLWSPYLAGRDPAVWDDPMSFRPERHLGPTDAAAKAVTDAAWVPFGGGPRRCIGFALAQAELVLVLARLAQRLDVVPGPVPVPFGMVVNRPFGGVPCRVSRRASGRGERDPQDGRLEHAPVLGAARREHQGA